MTDYRLPAELIRDDSDDLELTLEKGPERTVIYIDAGIG
jgi:hypothetical protein